MPVLWILVAVLAASGVGYVLARARALATVGGDIRKLHSLPAYYGWNAVLATAVPSLLVLAAWLLIAPAVIQSRVAADLPDSLITQYGSARLAMADVQRIATGLDLVESAGLMTSEQARLIRPELTDIRQRLGEVGVALGSDPNPAVVRAAQSYRVASAASGLWMTGTVLVLAGAGLLLVLSRTTALMRARNTVEQAIKVLLILASLIAILTTVAIVASMIFETRNFFVEYSWHEFLFGTTWSPDFRGNSSLGILPLLWGTLYISLIALTVAVPVGLFAAIYMSEYASRRLRSVAKPLIEVLAGIPTIVYGLFALVTVGPALRDYFAEPLGLGSGSSSVMTAGLVMGIMLIPFVSSLSDDIINAVPQSMRDGSYGLGATQSETIRQVIVPAALPGIVGAILLAASRAIGETMIVVLGAGAAARLSLNPFEAMTTVTVKIVGQLTGDTDFSSPEALVAFALGLTLFVITLGLNVLALYIVRKYREQYE